MVRGRRVPTLPTTPRTTTICNDMGTASGTSVPTNTNTSVACVTQPAHRSDATIPRVVNPVARPPIERRSSHESGRSARCPVGRCASWARSVEKFSPWPSRSVLLRVPCFAVKPTDSLVVLSALLIAASACSSGDALDDARRDALDATSGEVSDANDDLAADGPSVDDALDANCRGPVCNGACCRAGELCRHALCQEDLGRCTPLAGADAGTDGAIDSAADGGGMACPSDSYCDSEGYCTPYGVPPEHDRDTTCRLRVAPAPLVPAVQCEWTLRNINGTPVVADLAMLARGPDDPRQPSIVVAVYSGSGSPYDSNGYIHIFDGRTCELQFQLNDPTQIVASAGTPAVGDLDMDGRPEIVAASGTGGVIAFRFDTAMRRWVTMWRSADRSGPFTGSAIALADLGGDARPEIVLGGIVYDATGTLLDSAIGQLPYQGYSTPVALADVDLDGVTELVGNNGIYQLDATRHFVREPYDMATAAQGFVAVADFGEFPGRRGDAPGRAEIVFYATPRLIVRTVGGDTVFSADATPIAGGGPPAIADLDGDGQPEIVVAGHAMMAFDPDCTPGASRGGRCASGRMDGVLWTQSGLQDGSSAINGVTVFDIDGDGRAEVVEADECFVRIFDGTTGRPRWSAARFSCTFIEMPIVADSDGDQSAEIVVPANATCGAAVCGLAVGAPDPLLPGFACATDASCPMGSPCRGGLCRCTATADCGRYNVCTPQIGTSDGMGNVCRPTFRNDVGLRVYGDFRNRWVPSRPVWNQYSYAITNVSDDGVVPAAAALRNNWQVPGLNDFRRNTQGALGDATSPNLTIAPSPRGCVDMGTGTVRLLARFCNRGTGVAGADSSVQFDAVGGDGGRRTLCTATARRTIAPGTCLDVTCDAMFRPDAMTSIEAIADANDQVGECREDDNRRVIYRPDDCIN